MELKWRCFQTFCCGIAAEMRVGALVVVALAMCGSVLEAAQEPTDSSAPVEGRLYNASDRPFVYQLRRSRGASWSQPLRLEPNEYHAYRGPLQGGRNDLAGLLTRPSRLREGYLIIQFPSYGGYQRIRIRATDLQGRLAPYWFYVTDAGGHGHLVQARSMEQARAVQADLRKQPAPSPEQLVTLKRMLYANHVWYPAPPKAARPPSATRPCCGP